MPTPSRTTGTRPDAVGPDGVTPVTTPNDATVTRPERSSKRVARKAPLAWLPWLLLGLLALLTAIVFLVINAVDDDGPEGPAGDSLGQVSGSDGSGVNGQDEGSTDGGSGPAANPADPVNPADPGNPADPVNPADPGNPADPAAPGAAAPASGDLAALTGASLVGGNGIAPKAASAVPATAAKREPGTAGTVLFAEGSAELDAAADQVVANAVRSLQSAGAKTVEVAGFTDVVAGEQVNDPLSQERADAVAAALEAGLPGVQISTQARGQESPVAPNTDEAGRQQNRRASIVATG